MAGKFAVLALLALACAAHAKRDGAICPTYVVGPGDTVASIASKFKLPTTAPLEDAIAKCDPNYQAGGFLQLNQRICLPPTFSACNYVRQAGDQENCKYYIIQSGDTLETIALSLGLLRLDLEKVNPNANQLQVNQFVKLTGWDNNACPEPGDSQSCRVYVAAGGDSLSTIALAFSVDLSQLQSVNPDLAADVGAIIQPGMRVAIPPFTAACGAGVEVSKPVIGNCNGYQAQAGDTLYTIAAAFQTTTDLLTQANPGLAEGVLSPGTVVNIPPYVPEDCVNGINMVQLGQALYQTTEAPGGLPAPVEAAPAPSPSSAPVTEEAAVASEPKASRRMLA